MIQSLFILSSTGQVLIERHFRGIVTERDVCTYWMMYSSGFSTDTTTTTTTNSSTVGNNISNTSSITSGLGIGTSTTSMPLPPPPPQPIQSSSIIASSSSPPDNFNSYYCHPILEIPSEKQGTLYVISIRRDGLNYLAICPYEVNPLSVLEFLYRFVATLQEYFINGRVDEVAIKDNFITIYQLLEEMIDFGWPLTTEINALKSLIRPPSLMSKLFTSATGLPIAGSSTTTIPTTTSTTNASDSHIHNATIANIPWRIAGVHYSNNEIYVDIIEEVDAIVDQKTGTIVTADVQGSIVCQSRLSGIPDLLLTFNDPNIIDDCSFHPCVRYEKFERDSVVSFVPPDGNFELMKYRIDLHKVRNIVPPIYCQAQWSNGDDTNYNHKVETNNTTTTQNGRLSIQIGVASLSSLIFSSSVRANGGKTTIEDIIVHIPFPKGTNLVTDFRVTMGTVMYDEVFKIAKWNVASSIDTSTSGIASSLPATLTCKFTISSSSTTSSTDNDNYTSSMYQYIGMSTRRQQICTRYKRKQQRRSRNHPAQSNNNNTSSSWLLSPPNIGINWKIPLASISGIAVSGLSVMGENYRPYKGVRNITQAGIYQIRCTS